MGEEKHCQRVEIRAEPSASLLHVVTRVKDAVWLLVSYKVLLSAKITQ